MFISLGQIIGLWPTLLGVVVTALIGSALIRMQGLGVLNELRANTARGALPAQQIAEGMMLAVSGALLLTPGYFTDAVGFLLLVPPIRLMIYNQMKTRIQIVTPQTPPSARPFDGDDTIDLDQNNWRGD